MNKAERKQKGGPGWILPFIIPAQPAISLGIAGFLFLEPSGGF